MRGLRVIFAATAATIIFPLQALAQSQPVLPHSVCGTRAEVTDKLEATFGELQKGAGVVSDRRVLELWQSTETGSWTLLMTQTDGQTCIIAAGNHWRDSKGILGDPT